MRVAMGLALNEVDREARAIEFYNVLSTFDFMSSTPTLFNSGTHRSQLSSCYLTTVSDDLDGIYEAIKENALLSKFAGGLGNDWTNVRAMGSHIKGTNGKSQGVVPFLKVVNDTAVAVNQCFAPDTLIHTAAGRASDPPRARGRPRARARAASIAKSRRAMVYEQRDAMVTVDVKHSLTPLEVTDGPSAAGRCAAAAGAVVRSGRQRRSKAGAIKPEWVDAGHLQGRAITSGW